MKIKETHLIFKEKLKIIKQNIKNKEITKNEKYLEYKNLIETNIKYKNEILSIKMNVFSILYFKILFGLKIKYLKIINFFVNYKEIKNIQKITLHTSLMAGESKLVKIRNKVLQTLFLSFMVLIIIFPFYWMIINSFRSWDEFDPTQKISLWPKGLTFEPYRKLIEIINNGNAYTISMQRMVFNSFMIAVLSTITQLTISIIGGFALANWKTRWQGIIFIIMLSTVMIPGEALLLGQYMFIVKLGWINNLSALIVPFMGNVFTVYLMSNAFSELGKDVKKAAKVDGLNNFKYFIKVAIPSIKSTIWTSAIIAMISAWNSILWPSLVIENQSQYVTLPMLLWGLLNININEVQEILPGWKYIDNIKMSAATISVIPMIVLFLFTNKQIIKGITKGRGAKG